jgi:N-acyl-D-amino-acid deacylase
MLDLIIRNGTIVDGTGADRYSADIGVAGGIITAIGDLSNAVAKETIDATGCIVAPGFVDTHTHFDAQIFRDKTCSDAGQNGITTVVMTNCGFGFAPCRPGDRGRYMTMMESVEQIPVAQQEASLPWDWESFPEFIASLERTDKSVNATAFVPLNALMIYVMGIEGAKTRAATPEEMERMKSLLSEALDKGAVGLSLSHLGQNNLHLDFDGSVMPTDVMSIDQACELASVLKERGSGLIQCLSGVPGAPTVEMSERLAEASGRPVLHNLIPTSDFAPRAHVSGLAWLDRMAADGKDMFAASFCSRNWTEITLETSTLHDGDDTFRQLTFAGSTEGRMKLLADEDFRAKLREAYAPEQFIGSGGVIEQFTLVSVGESSNYDDCIGRTLGSVAEERGVPVVDIYADMNLKTGCQATFKSPFTGSTNLDTIRDVFLHDRVVPGGSDGGAHTKIFNGGQWATDFIVNLVRDNGVITLEQAHYKMSNMPCRLLGLLGRGSIELRKAADILVYDLAELYHDTSSFEIAFDLPNGDWRRRVKAGGYRYILVNGELTFQSDKVTEANPGRYLAPSTAA